MTKKQIEIPTGWNRRDKQIDQDERICFGIVWFSTEEDALIYDQIVRNQGRTYNGGYSHGMPCGRDSSFDRYENQIPRYNKIPWGDGTTEVLAGYNPKEEWGKVVAFAVTH